MPASTGDSVPSATSLLQVTEPMDPHSPDLTAFITSEVVARRKQVQKYLAEVEARINGYDKLLRKLDATIKRFGNESNDGKVNHRSARRNVMKKRQIKFSQLSSEKKTLASIEKVIDAAITRYATASCLALTSYMYRTLPRELRDMIYVSLLVTDGLNRMVLDRQSACVRTMISLGSGKFTVPVTSKEYMGEQVFEELAEMHMATADKMSKNAFCMILENMFREWEVRDW
ncbi:hypothetical protein K491DRAFT_714420 [Lophiostoma macrostomum CBS 122681]|uniref:Uncharacterized protein n=1 Tax=Lophiostoma macrostomum CBS 122681 TaxID=1314788 RepID=A0A6A6TE41_9PLEO|nr:hypothetical protein K491DRAFT_714420 [Lophiostoma macrostomum CBS 122681]